MTSIIRFKTEDFPKVSIHDCVVSKIKVDENSLSFIFDDGGIWVKEKIEDCFRRVKDAELVFYDTDTWSIGCFTLTKKKGKRLHKNKEIICTKEFLEISELAEKINNKIWRMEFIDWYGHSGSSLFICEIDAKKSKSKCFLDFSYSKYEVKYNESTDVFW